MPSFERGWIVERNEVQGPRRLVVTGIDRGVHVLAATCDGRLIDKPRHLERERLKIERLQRTVARRKRGGKQRRTAVAELARAHERGRDCTP